MGYNTRYSLRLQRMGLSDDEILKDLCKSVESAEFAVCDGEPMAWYEHEEKLLEFSKRYPQVLFILDGKGDDAGDVWRKYFMNGKVQVTRAEIRLEEFDPKKLQEPAQQESEVSNG
jgi:hypothetical protein